MIALKLITVLVTFCAVVYLDSLRAPVSAVVAVPILTGTALAAVIGPEPHHALLIPIGAAISWWYTGDRS